MFLVVVAIFSLAAGLFLGDWRAVIVPPLFWIGWAAVIGFGRGFGDDGAVLIALAGVLSTAGVAGGVALRRR
jgi:hypothetical protein